MCGIRDIKETLYVGVTRENICIENAVPGVHLETINAKYFDNRTQYAMFNVWHLVTAPYLQVSVDSVLVKGVADRTNGVSSYDTSST